jgi:hypothetical protein
MQSFTEKCFNALMAGGATSQQTGLTANELAKKHGFPNKDTSTILGNLHRKELANRAYEQKVEGLRGAYRYWLVKGAGNKAVFHKQHGGRRRKVIVVERNIPEFEMQEVPQVERRLANTAAESLYNGGLYTMVIRGPNSFQMSTELPEGKLTKVIAAANGGQ